MQMSPAGTKFLSAIGMGMDREQAQLFCAGKESLPAKREYTAEELNETSYQSMAYHKTGTWRDYLPVRKLSEEEWDLYQQRKALRFQEQ